jgi:hypothetical protein
MSISEDIEKERLEQDRKNLKHTYKKAIENGFNELLEEHWKEFLNEHPLGTAEEHGAWQFYQFLKSK